MTVNFPWASLLRGVLGHDHAVLAGVARLLAPGAGATALVSVLPRDGVPAIPDQTALAGTYERLGLMLVELRPATTAEVADSGSSWAKRLGAGRTRPVTLLRFQRPIGSAVLNHTRDPSADAPANSTWAVLPLPLTAPRET